MEFWFVGGLGESLFKCTLGLLFVTLMLIHIPVVFAKEYGVDIDWITKEELHILEKLSEEERELTPEEKILLEKFYTGAAKKSIILNT